MTSNSALIHKDDSTVISLEEERRRRQAALNLSRAINGGQLHLQLDENPEWAPPPDNEDAPTPGNIIHGRFDEGRENDVPSSELSDNTPEPDDPLTKLKNEITADFQNALTHPDLSIDDAAKLREAVAAFRSSVIELTSSRLPRTDLPVPSIAPELWADREKGTGERCIEFLIRNYSPWLSDNSKNQLRKEDLYNLDIKLYWALSKFISRNNEKPEPEDIDIQIVKFWDEDRSFRIKEELEQYGIVDPSDAYALFPDDRPKAERLYQAARRQLVKPEP